MNSNYQLPPKNVTYFNEAKASSGVIKPSPGRLRSFGALNLTITPYYILLFNSDTGDVSGEPFRIYPLYPSDGWTVVDQSFWGEDGLYFSKGITWAASSSPLSTTAVPPNDCVFEAKFD